MQRYVDRNNEYKFKIYIYIYKDKVMSIRRKKNSIIGEVCVEFTEKEK
jgi:hypothetical protein